MIVEGAGDGVEVLDFRREEIRSFTVGGASLSASKKRVRFWQMRDWVDGERRGRGKSHGCWSSMKLLSLVMDGLYLLAWSIGW